MIYHTTQPAINLSLLNNPTIRPFTPHGTRSKGIHLTDVVRALTPIDPNTEKIVFGRNIYAPILEDDLPLCMAVGMAWEDMLFKLQPRWTRVGEFERDGIAMSPDAVTYNDRAHFLSPGKPVTVLEEVKCTWKSSSRPLESFTNYLGQTKSYCGVLDTEYCRLHILHINGNYKFGDDPEGGPHYYCHHIRYSPFELQTNWQTVLRGLKILKGQ